MTNNLQSLNTFLTIFQEEAFSPLTQEELAQHQLLIDRAEAAAVRRMLPLLDGVKKELMELHSALRVANGRITQQQAQLNTLPTT
jgi:hypothetical protein